MPYHHFLIPAAGGGTKDELNQFLRMHRVVKVKKQFAPCGGESFWAYQLDYAESEKRSGLANGGGKKGMVA